MKHPTAAAQRSIPSQIHLFTSVCERMCVRERESLESLSFFISLLICLLLSPNISRFICFTLALCFSSKFSCWSFSLLSLSLYLFVFFSVLLPIWILFLPVSLYISCLSLSFLFVTCFWYPSFIPFPLSPLFSHDLALACPCSLSIRWDCRTFQVPEECCPGPTHL